MMQDIFEVRTIVYLPPPGNFSADALDYYVSNTPKPNLSL